MILSIGEILADMIGQRKGEDVLFLKHPGGAPFNVACNLARLGTDTGFCGRVGNDIIGKYLSDFALEIGFKMLDMQRDVQRNTTLAFVELDENGERSFCFYRKNTADYHIDTSRLDSLIKEADTVHLGSLMLSEKEGRSCADIIIELTKKNRKRLSFDINYRDDIFPTPKEAVSTYSHYMEQADIIKFSKEEAMLFTGTSSFEDAVEKIKKKSSLSFITLGSEGSICVYRGDVYHMETVRVNCVDTTGAGDAFLAGALSVIDGAKEYTQEIIENALRIGNVCGAITATEYGAINKNLSKKKAFELASEI